jgi:hypothetical protein
MKRVIIVLLAVGLLASSLAMAGDGDKSNLLAFAGLTPVSHKSWATMGDYNYFYGPPQR